MGRRSGIVTALALVVALSTGAAVLAGCTQSSARTQVQASLADLESARPYYQDIVSLNQKIPDLGSGSSNLQDMLLTGGSIVTLVRGDLEKIAPLYDVAQSRLQDVRNMSGAGDYATYAGMAIATIDAQNRSLDIERQLMDTLEDMLSVIPDASTAGQLGYYSAELERLASAFNQATDAATQAANQADQYFRDQHL